MFLIFAPSLPELLVNWLLHFNTGICNSFKTCTPKKDASLLRYLPTFLDNSTYKWLLQPPLPISCHLRHQITAHIHQLSLQLLLLVIQTNKIKNRVRLQSPCQLLRTLSQLYKAITWPWRRMHRCLATPQCLKCLWYRVAICQMSGLMVRSWPCFSSEAQLSAQFQVALLFRWVAQLRFQQQVGKFIGFGCFASSEFYIVP